MEPGQTILNGKYQLQRLIGEGGMARVWLAEELTFGHRRVAIKEPRIAPQSALAHEIEERYRREVQVCAALEQAGVPHIVRALTAEPSDGGLLLVMEYMPGGDLAALLREHPGGLPVEQVVSITLDLLRALEGVHAHELEIVHRDIKPSNVLFDGEGRAHLADFGLAQLAGMSGRSQLAGGQHPGTPIYMAPEQARSPDMLLPAADIFALGCVLFEMLTGQRYKRHQPGTRVSALRAELPPWLDGIVAKALQEDQWQRWRDAGEMAASIGEAEERAKAQAAKEARRREAEERARAQAAEEARRREAEEQARAQAAEEARLREAEERAKAQAVEEARRRETEERQPRPDRRDAVSQPPRRAQQPRPVHRAAWSWSVLGTVGVLLIAVAVALVLLLGGGPDPAETRTPEPTRFVAAVPTAADTLPPTHTLSPSPTPLGGGSGRIAFSSDRDGNYEIYVMNADGNGLTRLTNDPTWDIVPAWSPDGTRIAFTSDRDDNTEIYAMNADGSGQTRLTDDPALDSEPAWSPDGTRIAFSSDRDGNLEIYVMNADGSGETRLTDNPAPDRWPAWSPDRTRIAFASSRDGNFEIYVMNADGSGLTRLTDNPAADWFPAWSPDGRRIAFDSNRDGDYEIYVMNADGSGQTRLTDNPATDAIPAWSPDGTRIVFFSERDGDYEIYVMNADGSGLTRLTDNPAGDWFSAWSP